MREVPPTPHARIRTFGLAALAALAMAACGETPTEMPAEPDQAASPTGESFQVIQTPTAGLIAAGRVIVKFHDGRAPVQVATRFGNRLRTLTRDIQILSVPAGRELATAHELSGMPEVEYAEPDYVRTLSAAPSDTYFGYKWGLHNDGTINSSTGDVLASTGSTDADIDWLEAYEHLAGSSFSTVRIAILDTGVRQDHVDLAAKIVGQYDFFDDDPDAADDDGHGSHTAGIAAAIGNDGTGTIGVAWHDQAQLLIAKVCGPTFPFGYGCPSSGTAQAITWAADNGARVINLSLGGATGSAAEQDALQYALTKETLAFCATGNDDGPVSYPAAFPECVAVGATDWSDNRASYSNFGPQTEIAAPGGDDENANGYSYILSAYNESATSYVFMAGTSMATPMATGLGGLLASVGVSTAAEIRSIMTSTADDLGPAGRDDEFGYGRINAYQAVLAAGGSEPPANSPPSASFSYSCTDLSCDFDGTGSSDPDGDPLSYSWTFGDGGSATGATASHSYGAAGTYTATLTVSDGSASDSQSQSVTVTEPSSGGIDLTASADKYRGQDAVALSWTGATSADVDVYRNGSVIATVANDGSYQDVLGRKISGTYTHQVCEAGTSVCSNQTSTTF